MLRTPEGLPGAQAASSGPPAAILPRAAGWNRSPAGCRPGPALRKSRAVGWGAATSPAGAAPAARGAQPGAASEAAILAPASCGGAMQMGWHMT